MYRSLFRFRRLMATSFLLVFVNVFVGQCWCATLQPAQAAPVAKAAAPAQPTHPGCSGHGPKITKPAKTQPTPQPEAHSGKADCCEDNSAAILKSLTTPGEKQLAAPSPALLPASTDFYFHPAAGQWARYQPVVLVPREHLPPKIPDIRIFIQSLTV